MQHTNKTHTRSYYPKRDEWELRNKRKCSSRCHHPATLSGLTLTLKWKWPHHMFSQIIINDMILTLPDSFFFLGSSPFCLSLWFCALVIWPSRLYSHCEAEEQKDGSNSFCATPQARLLFPSAHYLQTRLRISAGPSLAQTHHTPGGWG